MSDSQAVGRGSELTGAGMSFGNTPTTSNSTAFTNRAPNIQTYEPMSVVNPPPTLENYIVLSSYPKHEEWVSGLA